MRLAIIAPWYERRDRTAALMERVLHESSRRPDLLWVIGETPADVDVAQEFYRDNGMTEVRFDVLATPRSGTGYEVIPHANKINWALSQLDGECVGYLDNLSMPAVDKYERMMRALEEHPDWGAVYCGQESSGRNFGGLAYAIDPIADAYCVLNYTQVIHRDTQRRWPLDMAYANLGEALLWRELHQDVGAFHPVGPEPLDGHEFVAVDWHS